MEMNLQFNLEALTTPAISPSYFSSDEDMDVDIESVDATSEPSGDSDIEVIACYRHVPVPKQGSVAGRQMTTELSDCTDSEFPPFPWDDFEDMLKMTEDQVDTLDRGAGPSGAAQTGSPPIKYCGSLTPLVDTPLSPPPHERGPTYSPCGDNLPPQLDQPLPLSSHIQVIRVRMASHCGQPNTATYGDCIVCGRSYEQINETAVLDYLENTTNLHETYGERLKRRAAYLAGMDQGTVLFVPRGVSQAAACDGNYYQILVDGDNTNPPPGVLPI